MSDSTRVLQEQVKVTSEAGRKITCTVALGRREEFASQLVLLGTSESHHDGRFAFSGRVWVREDRDTEPDAGLEYTGTCVALRHEDVLDIVYAIFSKLDDVPDGLIAQEMSRICGD